MEGQGFRSGDRHHFCGGVDQPLQSGDDRIDRPLAESLTKSIEPRGICFRLLQGGEDTIRVVRRTGP